MKKKATSSKGKASRKVAGANVSANLRRRVIASGAKQSLSGKEIASSPAAPRNDSYSSGLQTSSKDFAALIAEVRDLIQSARHVPRIVQKASAQSRSRSHPRIFFWMPAYAGMTVKSPTGRHSRESGNPGA
jgi:hypothetical protein